jgi:dephospho-CoA kinase
MRVFGLTGNFGSGKSTVAGMLRSAGIPVIDSDRLARDVTAPGGSAYQEVVREFGEGILLADGAIDRRRLGEIVFADPERRRRLEAVTHPAILCAIRQALADLSREGHTVAIVEAALIHESGRKGLFDAVISVYCDEDTMLRRVTERDGISREQAQARVGAQMDAADQVRRSEHVIDNSGTLEETRRQVQRLAGRLGKR